MIKPSDPRVRAVVEAILKRMANEGRLIEGGWLSFLEFVPPNTTAQQVNLLKLAYYCCAEHLFNSIMTIMDEDREPTENDLKKMSLLQKEISAAEQWLWEFVNKKSEPAS
jgi:hypothetical protein